jgi:hypothetical protein
MKEYIVTMRMPAILRDGSKADTVKIKADYYVSDGQGHFFYEGPSFFPTAFVPNDNVAAIFEIFRSSER